jgi:hypothetical protein
VSVLLLLSMYTAYSSRVSGRPCPLFLSPDALLTCNIVVCFGIPYMHDAYGQCVNDNAGLVVVILLTTLGVFGGWIIEMLAVVLLAPDLEDIPKLEDMHKALVFVQSIWEFCIATGMIIVAYLSDLDNVLQTTALVLSCVAYVSILLQHLPRLSTLINIKLLTPLRLVVARVTGNKKTVAVVVQQGVVPQGVVPRGVLVPERGTPETPSRSRGDPSEKPDGVKALIPTFMWNTSSFSKPARLRV